MHICVKKGLNSIALDHLDPIETGEEHFPGQLMKLFFYNSYTTNIKTDSFMQKSMFYDRSKYIELYKKNQPQIMLIECNPISK